MTLAEKKKRKRPRRPLHVGCLRMLFALIIAPFALCGLGWLVLNIQYSAPFQRLAYGIQQASNRAVPAEKESELIVFSCGSGIYTIEPDGSNLSQIHGGYLVTYGSGLAWSPDGMWLAAPIYVSSVWQRSEVLVLRFDGSVWRRLTFDNKREEHVSWSPDGQTIYYVSGREMYRAPAAGGKSRAVSGVGRVGGGFSPVAWSPDGKWLAYDYRRYRDDVSSVRFLSFDDSESTFEHKIKGDVYSIVWAPDSERVVLDTHDMMVVYNIVQKGYDFELAVHASHPVWSPDGRWLALSTFKPRSDNDDNTHLFDTWTGDMRRLLEGRRVASTWSPDSEWIAFTDGLDDRQLFKIRRDGSDLQQLTEMDCRVKSASWSPR